MATFPPLPEASSPSIRLAHPTPEQKHIQTVNNSEVWRGPLSQEAYLRREDHLAEQTLTANFGITHWVLIDAAEPERSRRVLCGCETIRKRAIVAQGGCTKDTISHCVSNVFCPPQHRGRGYARRMMKELGNTLRTHQTKSTAVENLFSTLWSDIGKKFYASLGWEPFPSSHICIPAASVASAAALVAKSPCLPRSQLLRSSDLASLCAADEQRLRKLFSARPASSPPAICLLPDLPTISWHYARERFIAMELDGNAPEAKGAMIPGPPGKRAWCYWTLSWRSPDQEGSQDNILHILRLVIEDTDAPAEGLNSQIDRSTLKHCDRSDSDGVSCENARGVNGTMYARSSPDHKYVRSIEALLRAAQLHATMWKMDSVQVWNPMPETVEAARRIDGAAKVVHRDKQGIPSMMWFGRDEDNPMVEWFGNEKYAWC